MKTGAFQFFRSAFVLLSFMALVSCGVDEKPVPPVARTHELVVVTVNGPTTLYEDSQEGYTGLEYDLATMFAKEMGLSVRFVVVKHVSDVLPAVRKHRAHFAAAGLVVTPENEKKVKFGPAYQTVRHQVVYRSGTKKPRSEDDLVGKKVAVASRTSYIGKLADAQRNFPGLSWLESRTDNTQVLLSKLAGGKVDFVVADSNHVDLARNFYPNLAVAFDLGAPASLAWAFPKDAEVNFLERVRQFFKRIESEGILKRLIDRYYGSLQRLSQADISHFLEKTRTTLPEYRKSFHGAEDVTGIDWRLLAALGYQESHWDPLATSPVGVRGLMMLTEETADRMKVTDRLDPKQSIFAGARYLVLLKDLLPDRIAEPDRTWIALAAYNTGYGHLEDARILAQRQGLNPDSWLDLKKALPLLTRPEHYGKAKHGFARGGESVIFVENVRTYYQILKRFESPRESILPSLETGVTVMTDDGS